ncbi:MAG: hypothetical protein RBU37_27170 [Myxococcota bacterium]|jgi:HEAT repeat protein|nr:hypothetical protein [Myxococcota bacterium]
MKQYLLTRAFARSLSLVVLLPLLFFVRPAAAQSVEDETWLLELQAVHLLLSTIDSAPTREHFEAAARDPVEVLIALAEHPLLHPMQRKAAVSALHQWPEERVRGFYERILELGEPCLQSRAVVGLARAFGESALPTLAQTLEAPDEALHNATVAALGIVGEAAKPLLEQCVASSALSPLTQELARSELSRIEARP